MRHPRPESGYNMAGYTYPERVMNSTKASVSITFAAAGGRAILCI